MKSDRLPLAATLFFSPVALLVAFWQFRQGNYARELALMATEHG